MMKEGTAMSNPRYANGALRRANRARLRAMGGECGICHGRFGPIHYDEPSDAQHVRDGDIWVQEYLTGHGIPCYEIVEVET